MAEPSDDEELSVFSGVFSPKRLKEDRWAAAILALSLVGGFGARFALALSDHGIFIPEEIHHALEPAHRLAFGPGLSDPTFAQSLHGWSLAGPIALFYWLTSALGLEFPRAYLAMTRLFFCLASGFTGVGCVALARKLGARWLAAAAGAAMLLGMGLAIYYAPRALGPTAAAFPLIFGLALALDEDATRARVSAGALLTGLAAITFFPTVVFGAGLAITLAARRRFKSAVNALAILLVLGFLHGLLDLVTRGAWFHSARLAIAPLLTSPQLQVHDLRALFFALGPLAVALGVFALAGAVRAPGLFGSTAAYLALICLSPPGHLDWLYPALPALCVLAAMGIDLFLGIRLAVVGRAAAGIAFAAAVGSAVMLPRATLATVGAVPEADPLAGNSAFDRFGPENRLLLAASERTDLCGLKVATRALRETGGYTYLHHDAPLFGGDGPGPTSGAYNYAIGVLGDFEGKQIEAEDTLVLVKLPVEKCSATLPPPTP